MNEYLTADEVVKLAGLKSGSVSQMAQRGRLNAKKREEFWFLSRDKSTNGRKEGELAEEQASSLTSAYAEKRQCGILISIFTLINEILDGFITRSGRQVFLFGNQLPNKENG